MTRDEMWKKANDRSTPEAEKKRLLQILHKPLRGSFGLGCSRCKKKLR